VFQAQPVVKPAIIQKNRAASQPMLFASRHLTVEFM
jgi:hypothetical protein